MTIFKREKVKQNNNLVIMKERNGKLYILVAECDGMEFKDYR